MSPLLRLTLVAAAVTLVAVVALHFSQSGAQSAWETLAAAHDPSPTVESLEAARDRAASTPAGPWIDYQLAVALFDRGHSGDLERAVQIAREALAGHPDHAVAPPLQRLLEAVESYRVVEG
jgi:hypothetical protein